MAALIVQHFPNVATPADLDYIASLPAVIQAREALIHGTHVHLNFDLELPAEMRARFSQALGVAVGPRIPMRWIRGDSMPHADHAWDSAPYESTFLVHLSDDRDGLFYVGDLEFPITAGHGYRFHEGLVHGTHNTTQDRLLMGPFNERMVPVGVLAGPNYHRAADLEESVYIDVALSGTLMSIAQINEILGSEGAIIVPQGTRFVGWMYGSTTGSPVGVTLAGSPPVPGRIYPAGTAFIVPSDSIMINLYPRFSAARRWVRIGRANWPRSSHARSSLAFKI